MNNHMKRKIYKYPLELADTQSVLMPEGAEILTAQMQGETLCLWALVDIEPELPKQSREIEIIGTGNFFVQAPRRYIATAQQGRWVWHIFERTA